YILLEADLPKAIPPERAVSLLRAKFKPVQNVYNLAAFSLDERCTTVFTIKSSGKSAFVLLAAEPTACDESGSTLISLGASLKKHLHNANKALGIENDERGILLRSWKMEISAVVSG